MAVSPSWGPAGDSRDYCAAGRYVVAPPGLDQHPRLGEAVEDLAVQQFIAKRAVEALVVAVLPGRVRRDYRASSRRSSRAISGPRQR